MTDTDHAMAANQYSKYADCMEEIKRRTEVVNCFLTRKCHAMYVQTTAESVSLQIRKILELIVLASLAADRSEYAKLRKNFQKDWKANRILETLEKVLSPTRCSCTEGSYNLTERRVRGTGALALQALQDLVVIAAALQLGICDAGALPVPSP